MWDNHHWLLFGVVGTVGEFCSHGAMEDNWCMLLHLCYTSPFCHDHQTRECCCLPQPSHSLLPRSLNAIIGDADKDESRHMTHKPLTFTHSLLSLLDNHLGETLCATQIFHTVVDVGSLSMCGSEDGMCRSWNACTASEQ
jgi:hypothetical protein